MLIIDGFMGKSRKLVDILIEKGTSTSNTIILDSVGILGLDEYGISYSLPLEETGEDELIDFFDHMFFLNKNIKYVVLEFNTQRRNIPLFVQLEKKYRKEFILTVQCPAEESQDGIKVYEI